MKLVIIKVLKVVGGEDEVNSPYEPSLIVHKSHLKWHEQNPHIRTSLKPLLIVVRCWWKIPKAEKPRLSTEIYKMKAFVKKFVDYEGGENF